MTAVSRIWPGSKARSAGKRKDAGSTPGARFGSPFSSTIVIYGTLSRDFALNETVKWLTSLAHLNAEIILVVAV